jgi:hypothetical protein
VDGPEYHGHQWICYDDKFQLEDEQVLGWRPLGWTMIETAPKDGILIDVRFDPNTAEVDGTGKNMAEFYAPGCTMGNAEPTIRNVRFQGGSFKSMAGDNLDIPWYGIVSVTLTP